MSVLKNKKIIFVILILFAVLLCLFSFQTREGSIEINGALNTVSQIKVVGKGNVRKIAEECADIVYRYDDMFSATNPSSEVSEINNADGAVQVSEEVFEIIKKSESFYKDTDGKFDITVGSISLLWNEAIQKSLLPENISIERLSGFTDYSSLILDDAERTVTRTVENQRINFGAVAKGYIGDRIAEYLKDKNVSGAMINLGGNVYAYGKKKDAKLWRVGITNPENPSEIIGSVTVENEFVISSGDYERYADIDGVRYHHIIDATTGIPSKSGLSGVTVISDNGFIGDCLSTSCFLVGLDEGVVLSKKYNAEVIFVTDDMKVYYPHSLSDRFDMTNGEFEYIVY